MQSLRRRLVGIVGAFAYRCVLLYFHFGGRMIGAVGPLRLRLPRGLLVAWPKLLKLLKLDGRKEGKQSIQQLTLYSTWKAPLLLDFHVLSAGIYLTALHQLRSCS